MSVAVLQHKRKGLTMEIDGYSDFESFLTREKASRQEGFISPDAGTRLKS